MNVQAGKVNMPGAEAFTINLGIFWEKAYVLCWQRPKSTYAREVDCIVRTRIGLVMEDVSSPKRRDTWWHLNSEADLQRLGDEVPRTVVTKALPFLEHFQSLDDAHDFMSRFRPAGPPGLHEIYLAIVKAEVGDVEGAASTMRSITGVWRQRAEPVAQHLGLEVAHA